jgi:hypothetical protein
MKNTYKLIFLMTFLVLAIGMVSACETSKCPSKVTVVNGIIYQGELTNTIAGANVEVTCSHEVTTKTCEWKKVDGHWKNVCVYNTAMKDFSEKTTSGKNGSYAVSFADNECTLGDDVYVVAQKGELTGAEDGSITTKTHLGCLKINIGIVNVPLVPEFGVFAGALTLLSAVGIFFFVRRK